MDDMIVLFPLRGMVEMMAMHSVNRCSGGQRKEDMCESAVHIAVPKVKTNIEETSIFNKCFPSAASSPLHQFLFLACFHKNKPKTAYVALFFLKKIEPFSASLCSDQTRGCNFA
ncbi:hypothetical protein [Rufibacter quisquiliarum]|uniref:Uncharacterized protein n=1 Tax=Rufibacter quisquiliarum TaxID=1549639 RepID=A0A839GR92_9BACT|nr:hypothetical protein [Rufibacter quisquiliarum]MBA9077407.1 hypothetical protein [Rufibacter quisquiliarum]